LKRESGEQGARAPALSPQRAPRPALRGQSAPLVLSLRLLLCSYLGHLPAALLAVRAPGGEERRGERDERAQKKALSRARPALFDGAPQECPGAWAAQPRHGACTIRWSTQKTNGIQEMCPSREGWVREKTKPRRCVVAPHSRFFFRDALSYSSLPRRKHEPRRVDQAHADIAPILGPLQEDAGGGRPGGGRRWRSRSCWWCCCLGRGRRCRAGGRGGRVGGPPAWGVKGMGGRGDAATAPGRARGGGGRLGPGGEAGGEHLSRSRSGQ